MSSPLPIPAPHATLDEDAWEDLLNFIEERRVIPIIGPELLKVDTETGPRLLYDWLAEKLAVKLAVDASRLPQPCTLNDVVCWFLSSRGRREEAYTRLRSIFREANFAPPASAAAARADQRLRSVCHDDVRLAPRAGNQRRALPGRAIDGRDCVFAESRRRSSDRARSAPAARRLSFAGSPVRIADLRHL